MVHKASEEEVLSDVGPFLSRLLIHLVALESHLLVPEYSGTPIDDWLDLFQPLSLLATISAAELL